MPALGENLTKHMFPCGEEVNSLINMTKYIYILSPKPLCLARKRKYKIYNGLTRLAQKLNMKNKQKSLLDQVVGMLLE